jgi:hypothetical protein
MLLKIQPSSYDDNPISRGRRDTAELRGVDVAFGIAELRRVQHIDRIDPELEFSSLTNADALQQVDVEPNGARARGGKQRDVSDRAGLGVHEDQIP